jgi:hypothetical protein
MILLVLIAVWRWLGIFYINNLYHLQIKTVFLSFKIPSPPLHLCIWNYGTYWLHLAEPCFFFFFNPFQQAHIYVNTYCNLYSWYTLWSILCFLFDLCVLVHFFPLAFFKLLFGYILVFHFNSPIGFFSYAYFF